MTRHGTGRTAPLVGEVTEFMRDHASQLRPWRYPPP